MTTLLAIAALMIINLGLLWVLIALPIGRKALAMRRVLPTSADALWEAVHPFGRDAAWSNFVLSSQPAPGMPDCVEQVYDRQDRKGVPIRRIIEIAPLQTGKDGARGFAARVIDDSALDISFWRNFSEERIVRSRGDAAELAVSQTDNYRGLAFYLFRWFMLRREFNGLEHWLKTGDGRYRGWIERPAVQVAMVLLSILALWPFFGLDTGGFALSFILTAVIVLHEFGHMAAYRACGHRSVRMIIIPFLGGVAIGSRPYDSLFEVAFCALMGAGMSAFLVVIAMGLYPDIAGAGPAKVVLVFLVICGGFNLLNLAPVVRFDGGQVLRQVFRGPRQLGIGSFVVALAILSVGWAAGAPSWALAVGLIVFAAMSLILTTRSVRPRRELDAMTAAQRALMGAGLAAAILIHGSAVVFAVQRLAG